MKIPGIISFRPFFAFAIAFLGLGSFLFSTVPAQAGGFLHFGYGHHGGHYGYSHSYGYGYSHPYYRRHSYYSYGHHVYGHHSYGYGFSNYDHHYNRYATPPYSSGDDDSSGSTYQNRTYDRDVGNGWTLLGNNQASAALSNFGRQAQASPSKGSPKVGYALASADLGRLDKGVWAMRRALKTDPDALHDVALDRYLDAKVQQIIQQYEKQQAYSSRDADTAFMLASLHFLRRDMKAARNHIHQAMRAEDRSASTINLRALIDKERNG